MFGSCFGPYQFQWRASNNPSFTNSVVIGNTQTISYTNQYCPLYLQVTVTNAFGMSLTSAKLFNCAPGVVCDGLTSEPSDRNEASKNMITNHVTCSPNPANNQLKVLFKESETTTTITIFDIGGKVRSVNYADGDSSETVLDISKLEQGLWYLHIQNSQCSETVKFSIVR